MSEFVLRSPEGAEYQTTSAVLRSRLLAQGYSEQKAGKADGKSGGKSAPAQSRPSPAPRSDAASE